MYVCVCMCVYIFVCMCVYMYVCVCMFVCMCVCIYVLRTSWYLWITISRVEQELAIRRIKLQRDKSVIHYIHRFKNWTQIATGHKFQSVEAERKKNSFEFPIVLISLLKRTLPRTSVGGPLLPRYLTGVQTGDSLARCDVMNYYHTATRLH